jgi:hypothetical protein
MLPPAGSREDHMNDTDRIAAAILASAYAIKSTGSSVEFFVDAYAQVLHEMAKREKEGGVGARLEAAIARSKKKEGS